MSEQTTAPGTRILERQDGQRVLLLSQARLEVANGADKGATFTLKQSRVRIGTANDCDWTLEDSTISSHHCELVSTEHGVMLTDLGSKNGTFVNGLRIRQAYLNRSAELLMGQSRILFQVLDDAIELPVSRVTNFAGLLGHSPIMQSTFAMLERAAATDSTLLIYGESGTGKELAARAVHERSQRSNGPYMIFDCGTAASNLIESQLFGHARGAFTGAIEARRGVFEDAEGGTLVLDEVGELPLELQPKLLRVLEAKTVQRVGENSPRAIDVRVIASTNRNLESEVSAGRFRQDLFFRLGVIGIRMPSLRERKQEIPRLIKHFLTAMKSDSAPELPPGLLSLADAYDWPGNVRELRNFVERYVVFGSASPSALLPVAADAPHGGTGVKPVAPASPADHPDLDLPFHEVKRRTNDALERAYLERLMQKHAGNVSEATRVAGISRQSWYRLMKKHGLDGDGSA